MAFVWSDTILPIIQTENSEFDSRFDFAPIPGGKSMLAGGAFFISKWSKDPLRAYDWILSLMNTEAQSRMLNNGLSSAFKTAYNSSAAEQVPYSAALERSLERGVYMLEAGEDADAISRIVTTELQRAWRGDQSAEQAAARIRAEIVSQRELIGLDP